MYHLTTKRTEKTNRRKRERGEFFETDNHACTGLQHVIRTVIGRDRIYVDFGLSRLSGLSLGAFINSTLKNLIAYQYQSRDGTYCLAAVKTEQSTLHFDLWENA